MGQSSSIQEVQKENEHRAYINKIEAELEAKAKKYGDDMDAKIKSFYTDNSYDQIDFISGRNTDFMQASEWSLANVRKIVESISKAVFGSGNLPEGVEANKDVGKSIANAENIEAYVAGKCFEVLAGIIESFGSASSVSFNSSYKSEPLGSGMHLFVTVVCDSYKSSDFFNNQEIYQYLYIYEVKYSVGEAKAQGTMMLAKLYEDQIATFTDKVEQLLVQLENDKITVEQYDDFVEHYNSLINKAAAALEGLGK